MEPQDPLFTNRTDLSALNAAATSLRQQIGEIVVGQHRMVELILAAMLADGHVLIEGVPGVAKTLVAKLVARSVQVPFARLQFTPDLMPSDVLGTTIYNAQTSQFEFRRGPIFASVVLIDEINRAPAKTQAALFEVMEERQATVDGTPHLMTDPFLVLATQNPVEQEGTYRLPEAQLDRFLFKIEVDYPTIDQETEILRRQQEQNITDRLADVKPVLSGDQILGLRKQVRSLHVEAHLLRYIAELVDRTRANPSLYLGASPRASMALLIGAKALAALAGRDFVTPEDIKTIAHPVLGHRILLTPEREMEGATTREVVEEIVNSVEIPR